LVSALTLSNGGSNFWLSGCSAAIHGSKRSGFDDGFQADNRRSFFTIGHKKFNAQPCHPHLVLYGFSYPTNTQRLKSRLHQHSPPPWPKRVIYSLTCGGRFCLCSRDFSRQGIYATHDQNPLARSPSSPIELFQNLQHRFQLILSGQSSFSLNPNSASTTLKLFPQHIEEYLKSPEDYRDNVFPNQSEDHDRHHQDSTLRIAKHPPSSPLHRSQTTLFPPGD
jgi:hypothetical protein